MHYHKIAGGAGRKAGSIRIGEHYLGAGNRGRDTGWPRGRGFLCTILRAMQSGPR